MSNQYLCYDLKGIQSFIFKIPKLKYIIGGSALIDKFDRKIAKNLANTKVELLFAGGGKGAYTGEKKDLMLIKQQLIKEAHDIGMDIRFGEDASFSQASLQADELYAFVPEMNDGYPCPTSALYPVTNKKEDHSIIKKRLYAKGELTYRYFEDKLLNQLSLEGINDKEGISFFHNVTENDGIEGNKGFKAIGGRNRWAVICMDGNDMGLQFRHQVSTDNPNKLNEKDLIEWIKKMSAALDGSTNKAAIAGIDAVVKKWNDDTKEGIKPLDELGEVVLPIRPLVVGGDDIVVLCHTAYALEFIKTTTQVFNQESKKTKELWGATQGELTITAGVLYSSVSLPLHTSIAYAEALLSSAKTEGRSKGKDGQASPPCIDWEVITDSIIDTPAAKRQRELFFIDEGLVNEELIGRTIKLTERPYTLKRLKVLEGVITKYQKGESSTLRHKLLPALSASYTERLGFYAEIKKHNKVLFEDLNEFDSDQLGKRWHYDHNKNEQSTDILDAIMLIEEQTRMTGAV